MPRKFKIIIVVILLSIFGNVLSSQQISGFVSDIDGAPLEGANIQLLNSVVGTASNSDGHFTIVSVGSNDQTLLVSYLGYQDVVINLTNENYKSLLNIIMTEEVIHAGKMIVNARKKKELVKEVPLSVSSISGQWLESTGVSSIDQIAAYIPNVFPDENPSVTSGITIRGIRGGVTGRAGGGSPEAIFIDGNYLGRQIYANTDILDFERIEFLRGPQGTIFGKNTLSGAINIITRKPSATQSSSIQINLADEGKSYVNASTNFSLSPYLYNRLSIRLIKETDYLKNLYLNEFPSAKGISSRYEGRYLKFPQLIIDFNIDFFNRQAETGRGGNVVDWQGLDMLFLQMGRDVHDKGAYTFNSNQIGKDKTNGLGFAFTLRHPTSSGNTLISQTSARFVENDILGDSDLTLLDFLHDDQERQFSLFTQEFRFHSGENETFNWFVGFHLLRQEETTDLSVYPGLDFDLLYNLNYGFPLGYFTEQGANITPHTNIVDRSFAVFGSSEYKLNSKSTITTGIRFSFENKDLDFSQNGLPEIKFPHIPYDENGNPIIGKLKKDYHGTAISPLFSYAYQVNDYINSYFTFSKGFKSGGFNTDFVATQDAVAIPFDPEFITNFEGGVKLFNPEHLLSLNISAFFMDYKDMQVSVYRFNEGFRVMNAASASSQGIEVEMSWSPLVNLSVSANYGYVLGEFDDYKYEDSLGVIIDHSGEKIGSSPENSINLLLDYKHEINDNFDLVLGLDYEYRSSYRNLVTETESFYLNDSRGLTNINLGLNRGEIGLVFWAKNVFDEKYTILKTKDLALGLKREIWGVPRTLGCSLRYDL